MIDLIFLGWFAASCITLGTKVVALLYLDHIGQRPTLAGCVLATVDLLFPFFTMIGLVRALVSHEYRERVLTREPHPGLTKEQ